MKKWLFIFPVLLIIIIWQGTELYLGAMDYQYESEQKAVEYVKTQAAVSSVTDVEHYHGSLAYHVVYGKTTDNEDIIVWVPDAEDGRLIIKKAQDGWSKEEVRDHVTQNQNPARIIDIRLGAETMKDNRTKEIEITPIWEVTYMDQQNRYTYYFIKFVDGSFVKRYSLKQK